MSKILKYSTELGEDGAAYSKALCPYGQTAVDRNVVMGLGSHSCSKCRFCEERDPFKKIVKCRFEVLDLSLTYHWYDEIESGRKCEEYRELTYYWYKRLLDHEAHEMLNRLEDAKCFRKYDAVRFHRGQGGKQTMMYEVGDIRIGYGNVRHGAPADKKCFVIRLGKRLQ